MSEQKKPRYVRVASTGDVGLVLHEYVQPASQWVGPNDINVIVVDNPEWRRPRHLKPGEFKEAPDYIPAATANFIRTKTVTAPSVEHRGDAVYWQCRAEELQVRVTDLERQLELLKAQLTSIND